MRFQYINIDNNPISIIFPADEILGYEMSKQKLGSVSYNLQRPTNNYTIKDGIINNQFKSELYNHIHVIDKNINLGFISQDTKTYIEVWNSYYVNKTINNYQVNDNDEINLFIDQSLPIIQRPNSSVVFTLDAYSIGGFKVDSGFSFSYNDQVVTGTVEGLRALLFDFDHNWITDYVEEYEFYTSIIKSVGNYEQRFTYSDDCLYSCKYFYSLKNEDKQKLDAILYNNVNKLISLPLYVYTILSTEKINVNDKVLKVNNLDHGIFQNGLTLLLKNGNDKETVDIKEIDFLNKEITLNKPIKKSFNKNSLIIPLIISKTLEVNKENINTHFSNYEITFKKEDDDIDMLITNQPDAFDKLNDINILELKPNNNLDLNYTYNSNIVTLTNSFGIEKVFTYNDINEINFNFNYMTNKKEDVSYIKNLFKNQKGMYNDLYIKNFSDDIIILDNILISDIIINIKNINASSFIKDKKIKYININYLNTNKIVEIIDIYKIDEEREAIVLKENLGININKGSINYASFIFAGRLNSDLLTLNYKTDGIVDFNLSLIKNVDIE